jgi:hypothetical protein
MSLERKNKEPMKAPATDRRSNALSRVARAWIGRLPDGAFYPGLVLGCAAAITVLYRVGVVL